MTDQLLARTIDALTERCTMTENSGKPQPAEQRDIKRAHRRQRGAMQRALRQNHRRSSIQLGGREGMTLQGNLPRLAQALGASRATQNHRMCAPFPSDACHAVAVQRRLVTSNKTRQMLPPSNPSPTNHPSTSDGALRTCLAVARHRVWRPHEHRDGSLLPWPWAVGYSFRKPRPSSLVARRGHSRDGCQPRLGRVPGALARHTGTSTRAAMKAPTVTSAKARTSLSGRSPWAPARRPLTAQTQTNHHTMQRRSAHWLVV